MPIDVTSWWVEQSSQRTLENAVKRVFVHSDDVSDRVIKWPSFKADRTAFRSHRVSLSLANEDNFFSYYITSLDSFYNSMAFEYGFTHPESGDEVLTIFKGDIETVAFNGGKCNISAKDRFGVLEHEYVGSPDSPEVYSDYVGNIVWDILTAKNSFSSVQSDSNPDIDWPSFNSWSTYYETNNIYMQSNIDGSRSSELIKKISKYTDSAIWTQNDRLFFNRMISPSSFQTAFTDDDIVSDGYNLDKNKKINKFTVYAGFSVGSGSHQITVSHQDSSDVSSYSTFEKNFKDEKIWFADSAGAILTAQKIVDANARIGAKNTLKTTFKGISRSIGDTINVSNSLLSLNETFSVQGYMFDFNNNQCTFTLDNSNLTNVFRLDFSELDGTDTLA